MQTGSPTLDYAVGAVIVIAILLLAVVAARRSKSTRLRRRFGPEYDRVVRDSGDRSVAEDTLAAREARVRRFHIEDLPVGARERYSEEWRTVQTRFVDEPQPAVTQADRLVVNVMRDRGYPIESFEQRVADISPDHPGVVENYRAAHTIAARSERGDASTEDLRQAMVHYRTLFSELLGTNERTLS
jgi:hypothetical protein